MSSNPPTISRGRAGSPAAHEFNLALARPFIEKSVSDATRAAYRRAVAEFFRFHREIHPSRVTPQHVIEYRDDLRRHRLKANTIATKLSIIRSFFEYLRAGGFIQTNPASTKLVPPPKLPTDPAGRALDKREARTLLATMLRTTPEGARDYAMVLLLLRVALRLSELCGLRTSSIKWSHGRWTLLCKIKGGRLERWPLPEDVKKSVDVYLKLDRKRRQNVHSDVDDAPLFQPFVNYRTLEFNRALSPRQVQRILMKYAKLAGLGKISPHDLRRTALTQMLRAYKPQDVLKVSKHKDIKTLMRYDHDRDNMDNSPVNTFTYDD
jgi:integrase/recombinase XerD